MLIFKWSADGRTISEIAGLLDIPEEQVRRVQSEQQKSNKPDLPAYPSVG
ncbi:MAG: hypothetical protein LUD07_00225 [Clostridiales bacterium]|nr:hypothetical protein [Clostridiales bacterium]